MLKMEKRKNQFPLKNIFQKPRTMQRSMWTTRRVLKRWLLMLKGDSLLKVWEKKLICRQQWQKVNILRAKFVVSCGVCALLLVAAFPSSSSNRRAQSSERALQSYMPSLWHSKHTKKMLMIYVPSSLNFFCIIWK